MLRAASASGPQEFRDQLIPLTATMATPMLQDQGMWAERYVRVV